MRTISLILLSVVAFAALGCGSTQVQTTKQEEDSFRNPRKEMPPEAAEGMRKAMEKVPGKN